MTTDQVVLLGAWLVACIAAVASLFWAVPTYFRLQFINRADELRDECMDHVLADELPLCPPVAHFLYVQDIFTTASRHLVIGRLVFTDLALDRCSISDRPVRPSFNELTPPQRKIMHDLQRRSMDNVAHFIRVSSPLAWIMGGLVWLESLLGRRHTPRVSSKDLAAHANSEAWERARYEVRWGPAKAPQAKRPPQVGHHRPLFL